MKTVSVTELTQYFRCQREYYLERVLKIKGAPYLPFIVGNAVHQFIASGCIKNRPKEELSLQNEESQPKVLGCFS
jgi:ATP-dependent helicase/DNAse subunit B